MKVSVSLPVEDLDFLDTYVRTRGYGSRSAVLHKAVQLLRASELGDAYEAAAREAMVPEPEGWWETPAGQGVEG